jgi:alanyl-tRNA synthetase
VCSSDLAALTDEQLTAIENEVNSRILAGEPVQTQNLPLAEARKTGATMLFGEKYADVVRVVSAGDFSKELCGGTHLDNTALVGVFKIVSEESVAAGTRRITAETGRRALDSIRRVQMLLRQAAVSLRVPPDELPGRVESLGKELRQLRKQAAAGPKSAAAGIDELASAAMKLHGVNVVITEMPGGPGELRAAIDQLRRKIAPVAVLLANRQPEEGKVLLIAGLSRDLVERGLHAVAWVKTAAALVDGGGGGRPDMAQAGGKLPEKLPQALEAARAEIDRLLAG